MIERDGAKWYTVKEISENSNYSLASLKIFVESNLDSLNYIVDTNKNRGCKARLYHEKDAQMMRDMQPKQPHSGKPINCPCGAKHVKNAGRGLCSKCYNRVRKAELRNGEEPARGRNFIIRECLGCGKPFKVFANALGIFPKDIRRCDLCRQLDAERSQGMEPVSMASHTARGELVIWY